ncbi:MULTISPECIES: SAM-dependent methyltransferase [unclassified Streptomyces]|uniref:SAM-dependent methyltransferase n=1 Tax=unclassified Streptomyces TaxID=2593676 RepID=UPI0006AFFF3A|nr:MULTISPECIES: class I SAM-dependent methyltransferase [unclassified Streptomyces]KOX19497.1 methyltransferase [Streptomyces sp. NRRL F-6491]KOX48262.1 methyltransferase [Streptomyces sp. NRRL F-6492]
MTSSDSALPPRLGSLTFHGPLSEARATRLLGRLAASGPADVLDIGCGWGELLLRVLEGAPGAEGVGIDINAEDLARGRVLAEERGLAGRVSFVEESALGTDRGPVDAILCLGSSQALCDPDLPHDPAAALRELRRLVRPGGRVVLGEGFWERTPTETELAGMWPGARTGDHLSLGALVDLAIGAGFRPAWIETASAEEWEEFESGYRYDTEVWLAANPGHPLAAETRDRVDRQRSSWLNGYRGVLGIAYLTLVAVAGD